MEIGQKRLILEDPGVKLLTSIFKNHIFAVGGCIRDAILNKPIKDIDFATSRTPEEMENILNKNNIFYIKTGIRRGTITAIIDNIPYEITTFRTKGEETIYSFSLEEDLSARDFTINAIALNTTTGELVDPFGGLSDLESHILKAVGNPTERFTEDPHRMLRMVRFMDGFSIDEDTFKAAKKSAFKIKNISKERIHDELIKILLLDSPKNAFLTLNNLGMLEILLPELADCVDCEQNEYHLFDVFGHTLAVVNGTKKDKITRLAALFHDIGKPRCKSFDSNGVAHFYDHETWSLTMAASIMERLKFSNEDIKKVCKLVDLHMKPTNMGDKGLRRLILELGDLLPNWCDLKYADIVLGGRPQAAAFRVEWEDFEKRLGNELNRKDAVKSTSQLNINGHDLIGVGISPGPKMGKILNRLLDLILDEPALNEREFLLKVALEFNKEFVD